MTASLRGLAALALIAIGLALAALVGARGTTPIDRAVLSGFTGDAHALRWVRPGGEVRAIRAGDRWSVGGRAADPRAIDAVLGSLRGARWHRDAPADRAGAIRATLYIDDRAIGLGAFVDGADQAWLVIGDRARLVDGWLARALDPDPLSLIVRTPFADAARAPAIRIAGGGLDVSLSGRPRRIANGLASPALVDALDAALADVAIVDLPAPHALPAQLAPDAPGITVALGSDAELTVGGPCPDAGHGSAWIALRSPDGDGCVDAVAWQAVVAAALAVGSSDAIDPRPAGMPLAQIAFGDGVLDLSTRPRVLLGGAAPVDADLDRVAELLAALAQPGGISAPLAGAPRATLALTTRDGDTIALDVYASGVVRRGEAREIEPPPAMLAVLLRPARALVDPTRWAEDASAVARVVLDGVQYDRGAVLGEWTRTLPLGATAMPPTDLALVDALAAAAATVRAPDAALPADFRWDHHLAIALAPPAGARTTHALDLAAPTQAGCLARLDRRAGVRLPLALCTAVAALAH